MITSIAQDTGTLGYNVQMYHPSSDPYGIWSTHVTKMLKPGTVYSLIETNFSGGQLTTIDSGETIKIVDKILTTNFLLSIGVTDFASIGVDVPIHFWQKSASTILDDDVIDPTVDEFTTRAMGDVRLFTKWRLLKDNPDKWHPGIGLLLYNTFSTGNERKFLGDSGSRIGAKLILDKDFGRFLVSVNAGFEHLQEKTILSSLNIDDRVTYNAGVKVPTKLWGQKFDLIADVSGHFQLQNSSVLLSPLEYHTGIRTEFSNGIGVVAGGGGSINRAFGNPDYRAHLGLYWKFDSKKPSNKPVIEEDLSTPLIEDVEPVEEWVEPPQHQEASWEFEHIEEEPEYVATESINETPNDEVGVASDFEEEEFAFVHENLPVQIQPEDTPLYFNSDLEIEFEAYQISQLEHIAQRLINEDIRAINLIGVESAQSFFDGDSLRVYEYIEAVKNQLLGMGVHPQQIIIGYTQAEFSDVPGRYLMVQFQAILWDELPQYKNKIAKGDHF